jgi:hypothetical protein
MNINVQKAYTIGTSPQARAETPAWAAAKTTNSAADARSHAHGSMAVAACPPGRSRAWPRLRIRRGCPRRARLDPKRRSTAHPSAITLFDIKGVPATRRELIRAAVELGGKHVAEPYEAWIAADPFQGEFKVLIIGPTGSRAR